MRNDLYRVLPFIFGGGCLLVGCGAGDATEASASELNPVEAALVHANEPFINRDELLVPKAAPPFALTDQNGGPVTNEDLAGKVALIGFVFTSCPDICRNITATYLDMQDEFADDVDEDDLELILITTDPERDTTEQAKKYTEGLGGKWAFLTGTADELDEVWNSYHVTVDQHVDAEKSKHSWMVVLIDRSSKIRIRYVGQDVPRDILTADVRSMLEQKP